MEGQRGSSRKGFESIARNTILVYVLSNIYKVNLTTCTMNWKRNGYVELIYFQTSLFPHLFLRVQITFFNASFMSKDLGLVYRCTHYLGSFLNFVLAFINFLVTIDLLLGNLM